MIDRKIDQGQTVAAQFQTPELFVIAPDMREKMRDLRLGRRGRHRPHPHEPGERPAGAVHRRRLSRTNCFPARSSKCGSTPTRLQNVVTYPVVLSAANPELKLLPGMTATSRFDIDKHQTC